MDWSIAIRESFNYYNKNKLKIYIIYINYLYWRKEESSKLLVKLWASSIDCYLLHRLILKWHGAFLSLNIHVHHFYKIFTIISCFLYHSIFCLSPYWLYLRIYFLFPFYSPSFSQFCLEFYLQSYFSSFSILWYYNKIYFPPTIFYYNPLCRHLNLIFNLLKTKF